MLSPTSQSRLEMNPSYRIGIEVELLLKPIGMVFRFDTKLKVITDYIVKKCNLTLGPSTQLRNRVQRQPHHAISDWCLTTDNSVETVEWNHFPLELISPILQYSQTSRWREDIHEIFEVLSTVCAIETNQTCGVHIHITPARGAWGIRTVKELCRNIIYFEAVIESLVPRHRVENELMASSRRGSAALKNKNPRECLAVISRCHTIPQVINTMNDDGSRYFAWNFVNMKAGGSGTIEFRQPPGTRDAERVVQWAEFVVLFLHAARMSVPFSTLSEYPRTADGLLRFLSIHGLAGSDIHALESLFWAVG